MQRSNGQLVIIDPWFADASTLTESQDVAENQASDTLPSVTRAKQSMSRILDAAQRVYNDWDESDEDTYAGGGICHIIADAICDVLNSLSIDCTPVSCDHEQHVYVVAKFQEGVYNIDIPYHIYETGGGFSWKKIPDVVFDAHDVTFYRTSGDPEDFEQYFLENQEQGVAEGKTVTRIDSKPISDFSSNLKTYKHTDDWSQSGIDTGDDSYWTKKIGRAHV